MTESPRQSQPARRSPDAVERLYVLWVVSTLVLLLLAVVLTILISARLAAQSRALDALGQRVAALEQEATRSAEPARPTSTTRPGSGAPAVASAPRTRAEPAPPSPPTGAPPAATSPAAPLPNNAAAKAWLDELLRVVDGVPTLARPDDERARELLALAQRARERLDWSGGVWTRMAVLALLHGHEAAAADFAQTAVALGDPAVGYFELLARSALARNAAAEAVRAARRLHTVQPDSAVAGLLLAQASLADDDRAGAAQALETITAPTVLPLHDRMALGRVCVALERWQPLAKVLDSLDTLPATLVAERDFLRAVLLIHQQQLVEALAILDYLHDQSPEDAEIQTWRGAALTRARQFEAARQALAEATERAPGQPAGWYWRAVVELEAGQPTTASELLERALAASARYAPAWEALGTLALNRGDVGAALKTLERAVEYDPQRASAHFLIALAHAKASRREPAAEALRQAFRWDSAWVQTAKDTPVLARLFEPSELEALLSEITATQPALSQPATTAPALRERP